LKLICDFSIARSAYGNEKTGGLPLLFTQPCSLTSDL